MTRFALWTPRLTRSTNLTLLLPGVALMLCGVVVARQRVFHESDSIEVYKGLQQLFIWLKSGMSRPLGAVGRFPPFQYLTAYLLVTTIWSTTPLKVFTFWSWCSRLSFCGILWLMFRVGKQAGSASLPWLLIILILAGPFTAYGASTFNELPASLLIALFTAFVSGGGGVIGAALLFVAACLTKEVTGPLLAVIWLVALYIRRSTLTRAEMRKHIIGLLIAFFTAHSMHAAFNLLRYGSILNSEYLRDGMIVHNMTWRVQHAVSLWLSPNGGVLIFWPLLGVLINAAIICAFRDRMAAVAVGVFLLMLTLGLCNWTSPFGWWAWGPRLMLAWMPATIILLVRAYGTELSRLAEACVRNRAAFVVGCVIVPLAALAHVLALQRPEMVREFFAGDDQRFDVDYPNTPGPHHTMIMYQAWKKYPLMIRALDDLRQPETALVSAVFVTSLIVLFRQARVEALATQEQTDG